MNSNSTLAPEKAFKSIKTAIGQILKARSNAAIADLLAVLPPDHLNALKGIVDAGLEQSTLRSQRLEQERLEQERKIQEEDEALIALLSNQPSYSNLKRSDMVKIVANMRKDSEKMNAAKARKNKTKPRSSKNHSNTHSTSIAATGNADGSSHETYANQTYDQNSETDINISDNFKNAY